MNLAGFDGFGGPPSTEVTSLPRRSQILSTSPPDVTENMPTDVAIGEASVVRDRGDGGGGDGCFTFDHVPKRAVADVRTLGSEFRDNRPLVKSNTPIHERQRAL